MDLSVKKGNKVTYDVSVAFLPYLVCLGKGSGGGSSCIFPIFSPSSLSPRYRRCSQKGGCPPPNPREHFRFPLLPSQPPFLQFRSSIVCEAREKLTKGLVKCMRVVLSRKTIKMKMWNPVLGFFFLDSFPLFTAAARRRRRLSQ